MSQLIDINFAAPNALSYQRLTVGGLLLLAVAIVMSAYVWSLYQTTEQQLHETQDKLNIVAPIQNTAPIKQVAETASEAELQQAREILKQLSTPWNPLFNALESISMRNIALLSVEPNRKKQQLVLTGQAKNIESALSYIKHLEDIDGLSQVILLKHQIDQNDPNKPVGFTIMAQWTI